MKLHRILAVVQRHLYLMFSRINWMVSVVYWPLLHIVIWGITSVWIESLSHDSHLVTMILTALVLWQIVFRVNLETAKALYVELLDHNLINLFASPLQLSEWIVAVMILGVINMGIIGTSSALVAWLLYGVSVPSLGWPLVPFIVSLLVSGWCIGFFICGLLMYWGLKASDFLYSFGYLFAPFSAIYYPVSALPMQAQYVSALLPTTPIFEAVRYVIAEGTYPATLLLTSIGFNVLYLGVSLCFVNYMFEKSRTQGLGRLD